jgi:hypothetical protein
MSDKILYFNQKEIQKVSIESYPEVDLGFDYDKHEDYVLVGDDLRSDAGIVKIDKLIETLNEMKLNGANYVSCDWHCDHQDLDLYGVKFELATSEQVEAYENKLKAKDEVEKQRQIKALENRLKTLKGE